MISFILNGWVEDIGTALLFGIPTAWTFWKKIQSHHQENMRLHAQHAAKLDEMAKGKSVSGASVEGDTYVASA